MCTEVPPAALPCPGTCDACDAGVCVIDCNGDQQCQSASIMCPIGLPCRVECNGNQACQYASITCAGEHACDIECSFSQACKQVQLQCAFGPCDLACGAGGDQVCTESIVNCGTADTVATCAAAQATPPQMLDAGFGCECTSVGC
jgi:hypothetical protein